MIQSSPRAHELQRRRPPISSASSKPDISKAVLSFLHREPSSLASSTRTTAMRHRGASLLGEWGVQARHEAVITDPNTNVDTLIENVKRSFGVEVPRSIAYRARKQAFDTVIGDQRAQYTRIRDYLQAILDTNPGSRCIVTTKELIEHQSPNPRFHGLFVCLNASKEGFLNGCRPFIGVDGCFIKLTTGQQILAATRRDGNNNIFPIAFAVVDHEDTASWSWFLTQLKYCIGESGQWGPYTIISDRQKN